MTMKKIKNLQKKIERKRASIAMLGSMRPGSLTKQYRNSKEKTGEFYQLSYTHHSRSRSELVRPEHVKMIRAELKEYQKHKKLCGELIEVCIELSKAKLKLLKEKASK
jgi:hypothetical protein